MFWAEALGKIDIYQIKMKKLIIAFFCGSLLSSGILIALDIGNDGIYKLDHGIKAVKQRVETSFKIYHNDKYMFDFNAFSNGFFLFVREDDLFAPRLKFSKFYQYPDGILYELSSNRMLEDGSQLIVQHNMETGEIETSIHADGFEIKAYDKDGNLIETDGSSIELLNLRRKQLSEALKREGNKRE